jgi:hypothetical protein
MDNGDNNGKTSVFAGEFRIEYIVTIILEIRVYFKMPKIMIFAGFFSLPL